MLVLRPGALGDTLLALPALRGLRRRFAPITFAAHAGAARLLLETGEIDVAMSFDDPRIARTLKGEEVGGPLVAWLDVSRLPGLPEAVVVAASRPADEKHCARYLLQTLASLGVDQVLDDAPLRLEPIVSDEVLVHPGSGSAAKNWPAACFAALMARLPRVRMIVGEADTHAAEAVEHGLGRRLPRLEQAPLMDLAKRLAGCRAYVGNDSGVSQLAGLCGAPTFVLFGPTSPSVWRPLGPRVSVYGFDTGPEQLANDLLA